MIEKLSHFLDIHPGEAYRVGVMASLLFFLIGANQEEPRYFPPDKTDKMIEWQQLNPGRDLYYPRSAAAQLRISESFFRSSVKNDPTAPVIIGRGMIACNTPALQQWWDGKSHHR